MDDSDDKREEYDEGPQLQCLRHGKSKVRTVLGSTLQGTISEDGAMKKRGEFHNCLEVEGRRIFFDHQHNLSPEQVVQ